MPLGSTLFLLLWGLNSNGDPLLRSFPYPPMTMIPYLSFFLISIYSCHMTPLTLSKARAIRPPVLSFLWALAEGGGGAPDFPDWVPPLLGCNWP